MTAPEAGRPASAAPRRRGWRCPRCHQAFVRQGASHSCSVQPVEALFAGQPDALAIALEVLEFARSVGDVEVAATKTQVSCRARIRFAWVSQPLRWAGRKPPWPVVVTFDLPRRLRSAQVRQAVETRPGRWTHHVELRRPAVGRQLQAWLREAYVAAC